MKPSVPSTSFAKVPGPDQTLKFFRTSGSLISTGRCSPAPVILILVVAPLANTRAVALKITRRQKAAEITRFIVPPLPQVHSLPGCGEGHCRAPCRIRHASHLRVEFGRNLQVHLVSVGGTEGAVNQCLTARTFGCSPPFACSRRTLDWRRKAGTTDS